MWLVYERVIKRIQQSKKLNQFSYKLKHITAQMQPVPRITLFVLKDIPRGGNDRRRNANKAIKTNSGMVCDSRR